MNDTSYCDHSIQFRVENRYLGEKQREEFQDKTLVYQDNTDNSRFSRTIYEIPDCPGCVRTLLHTSFSLSMVFSQLLRLGGSRAVLNSRIGHLVATSFLHLRTTMSSGHLCISGTLSGLICLWSNQSTSSLKYLSPPNSFFLI